MENYDHEALMALEAELYGPGEPEPSDPEDYEDD